MPDLAPLRPLMDKSLTARIKATHAGPSDLVAGCLGSTRFVVTLDADGHCEASLSTHHGKPSLAQIAAFWARWGYEPDYPVPQRISNGKALHWIVRKGRPQ